jgi:membrane protein DedA with SNARE-associated domain
MSDPLTGLSAWIADVIHSLGYIGVAFLTALESVIPIIPSELILPLSGFLAGQNRLWLPGVILAATVGSVSGTFLLYGLGYRLGEERVRGLIRQYGRWVFLTESDLDRAVQRFDKHGGKAVLFGRLIPMVRSLISIPAGIHHMTLTRFVAYTVLGSTVWNGVLVGLGWILGENWRVVSEYAQWLTYAVLIAFAIAVMWFVWQRWSASR